MGVIYKYRLLKDLPEYPKDCVFILTDDGWRAYWDGGDFTIPSWLEDLLYRNVPQVYDEMVDWFVPVVDNEQVRWVVDVFGNVHEKTIYGFWGAGTAPNVFTDSKTAHDIAKQIKQLFPTPTNKESHNTDRGGDGNW